MTTKPTVPIAGPAPRLPDRYVDARLVARGGMGEVWRARDTQLGRDVACKLLVPGPGAESEETRRERFLREARAIAQLSAHPHVITIYDIGELDGWPWLVMEWLPGGTLADRIAAGPVRNEDALRWLAEIADALDSAHAAGIVHRDVKPGNVLFDASDTVRIGDFGIARWSVEPPTMLTQPGAVIGTASYMSPEQARGEAVGPEGDQYALMVIAWQLLVGVRPFERGSAVAELAAHASDPVPSASERAGLPDAVDDVFARALAKDPARRYADCAEAVAALRDAVLAVGRSAPTTIVDVPSAIPRRRSTGATTVSGGRTRPVLAVAAILLLIVLVVPALGDDGGAEADRSPRATATTKQPDREPARTGEDAAPPGAEQEQAPASAPTRDPVERQSEPEPDAEAERADAIARHEEAFRLLQAGRFDESLPLALGALEDLTGVAPYEAYANYNVGASLVGLGRCEEARPYLDRSEQLQGHRDEIDAARAACDEASGGKGNGRGKGKGRGKG